MKGHCIGLTLVVCLLVATIGSAQVGINGTLSGTVSDATGALIPGVSVTATHTGYRGGFDRRDQRERNLPVPQPAARILRGERGVTWFSNPDVPADAGDGAADPAELCSGGGRGCHFG